MAIKNRTQLKSEFVSGTAATASKFEDLFDSHFNKYEDSVLNGPVGMTGTNGLIGPEGSTFFNGLIGPDGDTFYNGLIGPEGSEFYTGLWIDGMASVPEGHTANGVFGQVVVSGTSIYICYSTNTWMKLQGSTAFINL